MSSIQSSIDLLSSTIIEWNPYAHDKPGEMNPPVFSSKIMEPDKHRGHGNMIVKRRHDQLRSVTVATFTFMDGYGRNANKYKSRGPTAQVNAG